MHCHELAERIQSLQPGAAPRDVARLCLMLSNEVSEFDLLSDDRLLRTAWREASLKLQAATDQHQAMTEELEQLSSGDPQKFSPDKIWVLIRAIKVQSQVLQLYVGEAVAAV